MHSTEDRRRLREAVTQEVPERPGVYIWKGADGEPLYVGKAVNLRRRMLSYLSEAASRGRQRHLAYGISSFEYRPVEGELLALLLEDALIKALSPRHNVRQRDYLERCYVLLTGDRFPTCLVVEAEPSRQGTLYGPFKDRYFAAGLVQLINDVFGLRACDEREPVRRSARFDLGACPGPCRGVIGGAEYQQVADRVRDFLGGGISWVEDRLSKEIDQAAETLHFERAAEVRDQLAFCRRFVARQRFLQMFCQESTVFEEAAFGLTYRFDGGRPVAVAGPDGPVDVPPELQAPLEDPRFALDRGNILYTWSTGTPRAAPVDHRRR